MGGVNSHSRNAVQGAPPPPIGECSRHQRRRPLFHLGPEREIAREREREREGERERVRERVKERT